MSLASQITSLATRIATEIKAVRTEITSAKPTASSSFLTSNVTMTTANTFYTGPAITLNAGTYVIYGQVTVASPNNTAQRVTAKLVSSTTAYSSGEAAGPAQGTGTRGYVQISLSAMVTLASTTTLEIDCTSSVNNSIIQAQPGDNNSTSPATGNTASGIVALRIA